MVDFPEMTRICSGNNAVLRVPNQFYVEKFYIIYDNAFATKLVWDSFFLGVFFLCVAIDVWSHMDGDLVSPLEVTRVSHKTLKKILSAIMIQWWTYDQNIPAETDK